MGWIAESRKVTREYYNMYSKVCKELGIERVPYHSFDIEMYRPLKQKLNKIKYKKEK